MVCQSCNGSCCFPDACITLVTCLPQTNLSTTVERNCNRSIRTNGRGTLLVWTNWATAATLLDWIPTYIKESNQVKVCFPSASIKYSKRRKVKSVGRLCYQLKWKTFADVQLNAAEFSIIRTEVQVGNKEPSFNAGEATESYSYLKCSDHLEATMYVHITYSKWGYSKDNGEKAEDVKEQHGNIVVSSSQWDVWI